MEPRIKMISRNLDQRHRFEVRLRQRSTTAKVLALNLAFLIIVAGFGFYANSLVLLASAIHLIADTASLAIAYLAIRLASKPASLKYSFGLVRTEVLGALVNGTILLATAIWIIFEAAKDLVHPHSVSSLPIVLLGIIGLFVSATSLRALQRSSGKSLNMRAGVVHMAGDAAGWFLTVVSGLAIWIFAFNRADAIGSIVISVLIVISSWQILMTTVSVLLESTPADISLDEIRDAIESDPQILDVHHLHLWNLASDSIALSTHILMEDGATLHLGQIKVQQIKDMLNSSYGIDHVTIEVECHRCGDVEHVTEK
ncbi:MAG: cation transporter [Actinomycetota bacterium]|nr:MAG: cation transporter [Actinomycetota bacterium]